MAKFKTAHVKFQDPAYNYSTSINPDISDEEIKKYFVDKWLNLGSIEDDMQKCIDCEVTQNTKYNCHLRQVRISKIGICSECGEDF